jgi:hypothetical protein
MAHIVTLKGAVTAVRLAQNVAIPATALPTTVSTPPIAVHSTTTFRISNRPVSMVGAPTLIDGDMVTAAGVDGATFQVIALRNETAGTVQTIPEPKAILAFVFLALGIATLVLMLIGVIFIVIGVGYFFNTMKKKALIKDALAALATA